MKAVYRTAAAVLAILSGLTIAALVTALGGEQQIHVVWFVVFAVAALLAAGAALVLWARTLDRR